MDIKKIKEKFNLPISGGDGKSEDTPIVIDFKEKNNYVKLEYFIIKLYHKFNNFI